jgi:hypothetical protein
LVGLPFIRITAGFDLQSEDRKFEAKSILLSTQR